MKKPKDGTWEMFCSHANEVPNICRCPETCGYWGAHCKGKPVPDDNNRIKELERRVEQLERAAGSGRSPHPDDPSPYDLSAMARLGKKKE